MQGADVFATVSSPEEKQFLIATSSVPEDRIYSNKNTAYAKAVLRATQGHGVDVVFNTLLGGDKLQASSECTALGGRFLEIGRDNIEANVALPMAMFARGITFSAVDLTKLDSGATTRLRDEGLHLLSQGKVKGSQQIHKFKASDIDQAFKQLQSSGDFGSVIVSPNPEDVIPVSQSIEAQSNCSWTNKHDSQQFVREAREWTFDRNASYLIAGGSGGLGRAILRWMADRGAEHLIVPSRSGTKSKAMAETVAELTARGVNIVAPVCDVSSTSSLASILDECAITMPPIKGCINAAMVLQDAIFQNMTFAQWDLTMRSKVLTSWNLHHLLPKNLDFFVLLASLAGVTGQMASSNYAGTCTFQDALAGYRIAQGMKAVSLDMGWIRNIGIIAETSAYQRQRQDANNMQAIDDDELFALLTLCCDPTTPPPAPSDARGQMLFGIRTPADILSQGQTPPDLLDRPLFSAFSYIAGSGAAAGAEDAADRGAAHADQGAAARFRQAAEPAKRKQVVLASLAAKLARAMFIPPGDVESNKPLSNYGVDSLMAVDLRNWINREFGATVSTVDIQSMPSISHIADSVVAKSTIAAA